MKRIIRWFFIIFGLLILTILVVGGGFLLFSPQFGGSTTDIQKSTFSATGHFEEGVFTNPEEINMKMDCHSIQAMLKETMNPNPNVAPSYNLEVDKVDPNSLSSLPDSITRVTWFGHSVFLIETGGKRILIDPIFSKYAAPHPLLGRARFHEEMPIDIDQLPRIDAVIISHDHYDHLDYPSIVELKQKVGHFFVPLGVGNHLKRWKVNQEKISELDWWEEAKYENLNIVLTPSRHMSGRGLADQYSTLWGSWIIQSEHSNIYFSGDGGYGAHFKEIGDKYGPFDVGLMECGQYNELWRDVHMMPEETVLAGMDVKADFIIPIHWGSFALATHSWIDPVERVTSAAVGQNVSIATPRIGQPIYIPAKSKTIYEKWWLSQ